MQPFGVNLVALNPAGYSLAVGYLEANLRLAPSLAGKVKTQSTLVDVEGLRVEDFDLTRFVERITCDRPRVLAFSVFMWNHHIVREATRLVAQLFPDITIVLGGPQFNRYATVWDEYPDSCVVVMGEGESPLIAIVERLVRGESLDGVQGVALKREGAWRMTPPVGPEDLDRIASPILEQTLVYPSGDWLPSYSISRGCRYQCAYCSWGDGRGIRFFPMDRVERELEILAATPYERFWFTDCLFGADEERYVWLLRRLAQWPRRPAFGFETRAELLSPQLIEGFRGVRIDFLAIGIQTLNGEVLSNVGRRHNQQRVFEALDRLMPTLPDPGRVNLDVILGLPGDSLEGVKQTIDTLHQRYPGASFYFELLKVLPGTKMWETASQHGWVSHGPEQTYDLVQNESFPLAEVVELKLLGQGLSFLQRPHVRPHARRLLGAAPYSELALAAGRYLSERGLRPNQRLDGSGWLSARLARNTRRALREIVDRAGQQPCAPPPADESNQLTSAGR